jgi:hypothetical protein
MCLINYTRFAPALAFHEADNLPHVVTVKYITRTPTKQDSRLVLDWSSVATEAVRSTFFFS